MQQPSGRLVDCTAIVRHATEDRRRPAYELIRAIRAAQKGKRRRSQPHRQSLHLTSVRHMTGIAHLLYSPGPVPCAQPATPNARPQQCRPQQPAQSRSRRRPPMPKTRHRTSSHHSSHPRRTGMSRHSSRTARSRAAQSPVEGTQSRSMPVLLGSVQVTGQCAKRYVLHDLHTSAEIQG